MNHMLIILSLLFWSFGLIDDNPKETIAIETSQRSADLKIFDFEGLQNYLSTKDKNKTYVINFWATWCAPCVKELPYFEDLNANYSSKDVEVILVSLDFPNKIESKLIPFLKKRNLKSEVVVLDDVKSNEWIPKVNENWTGAIPATVIYNEALTKFYERSFTYEELESELKPFLK